MKRKRKTESDMRANEAYKQLKETSFITDMRLKRQDLYFRTC